MASNNNMNMLGFENQLIEPYRIRDKDLNQLFLMLLLSSVSIFLIGNALISDIKVIMATTPVAFTCFALILVCFAVSRIMQSAELGLVVTYIFLYTVAYFHSNLMMILEYGVCTAALIYSILYLRVERNKLLGIMMMALFAPVVVIGCDGAYAFFDVVQQLNLGNVHKDTLFHTSIAAMIKNYGVISTGLNGLVETPYHAFSHILMAGISVLSGASVLQVYGVAPWVLFVPILIYCVNTTCVMLKKNICDSIYLIWGTACLFLVVTPWLFSRWAFWNSYFVSESYLVSCGLLLFGLIPLFKHNLNYKDVLVAILVGALITETKGSVGVIYTGLWFLRVIFLRGARGFLFEMGIFVLITFVIGWIILNLAISNTPSKITPFAFIRTYSLNGNEINNVLSAWSAPQGANYKQILHAILAVLGFFCFHFLVSWYPIILLLFKYGWGALIRVPIALYSLGAIMAGGLIAIFYEIPAGSAYYFTSIAFFVSLPYAIIHTVEGINKFQQRKEMLLLSNRYVVLFTFFVALIITGSTHIKVLISSHSDSKLISNKLIESLQEIPKITPVNIALHSSDEIMSANPIRECTARPFLYPALTERPWTGVIVAGVGCVYEYYGYAHYYSKSANSDILIPPKFILGMNEVYWPGK